MKNLCSVCRMVDEIAYEYWDSQNDKIVRYCVECAADKVREMEKTEEK